MKNIKKCSFKHREHLCNFVEKIQLAEALLLFNGVLEGFFRPD